MKKDKLAHTVFLCVVAVFIGGCFAIVIKLASVKQSVPPEYIQYRMQLDKQLSAERLTPLRGWGAGGVAYKRELLRERFLTVSYDGATCVGRVFYDGDTLVIESNFMDVHPFFELNDLYRRYADDCGLRCIQVCPLYNFVYHMDKNISFGKPITLYKK